MTRATFLLLAGLVLPTSAFAGEIAYDLSPPTTSDRDSCGARDVPIDDFDHYRIRLYRCVSDSIVRRPPLKPYFIHRTDSTEVNIPASADSVRFTGIPDGVAGWTQVWSVDRGGLVSCSYLSATWATPAVEDTIVQPPPPDTSATGIWGRYYNGKNRNTLIATRRDTTINFQWVNGSPMPGVNVDQFSADWRGKLIVPTAGAWTLFLEVDDGGQLMEGVPTAGNMRIDKLVVGPLTEWSWSGNLIAGEHGLEIVFMGDTGNAQIKFSWSGPGIPKQVVPRSALR